MANLNALEALRMLTLYIKAYVNEIAESKLDADAINPNQVQNALASLDTRINAIVAAAGEASASSAEIVDARVSNSDVGYGSLGAHIRAVESGAALDRGAVGANALADGAVTPGKLSDSFLEQFYSAAQVDDKLDVAVPAGTIDPVPKTAGMTQPVGIGQDGKLYTTPTDLESLSGAMTQSVYDTQNLRTDVFLFARARANEVRSDLTEVTDALSSALTGLRDSVQAACSFGGSDYDTLAETMSGIESRIQSVITEAEEYAEQYAQAMLREYKAFTTRIVDELPLVGESMTFYLVRKQNGYEKYWWIKGANNEYMWDSFGSSSTLVLSELPLTGAEDVDYIVENGDNYVYYKWIDNQWKVVAGSLVVVLPASTVEGERVSGQLPQTGNELTDYYLETAEGGYQHYRWIGGQFVLTGGDVSHDAAFTALQSDVADNTGDIATLKQRATNLEASVQSLSGYVDDVTQTETGFRVSFGDGTSKGITTQDSRVVIEDIQRSENGIIKTYTDGTSEEIEISGGSGGAASGGAAITRLGDATLYCVYGQACSIGYQFNAFDAAGETVGAGTATWYVNGIVKGTSQAAQGNNAYDIGPKLSAGANTVKVSISVDTGGEHPTVTTKTWTVNAVSLYFTWDRDDSQICTTDTAIRWTPYGDLEKTTHIVVDGDTEHEITSTTTRSGTLQTYLLPALAHGAHLVEMYITATVNNLPIRTSSVYHSYIFVEEGETAPIIGSSFVGGAMTQYETVAIPITLYDPASLTTNADIYIDGDLVTTWTGIDRTTHYWNYSPTEAGTHTLRMVCGATAKTWTVSVTALNIDNDEVEGYTFRMKASEFAGNDALQAWTSNGISATFSQNFDWVNGGIQSEQDSKGNIRQFVCIKAGTSMTIHHHLFGTDCTTDGKNIKVMFRLANCRDYDAQWLTCYNGGIGLRCYAQKAVFSSEQSTVSVPYYEGTTDPIELEFDVTPKTAYSYIMPWIDGVKAGVTVYPANDAFVQPTAQDITIGSNDCDVYLYMIKSYPNALTDDNHLENFVSDAPNPQEMLERYDRNDILDANGRISFLRLAQANPTLRVHVYDIQRLFLGDKEADPITGNSYRMFLASEDTQNAILTAENVNMKIQGTSSVGYYDACANWDSEFTEGLTDHSGNHLDGMSITANSIPVDYVNNKVNQASCEGANNGILADWYNTFQPYIRPYRANTPNVRDTMEFQPGVAFFRDISGNLWGGDSESYNLYAIINCGNSKKNRPVFHDPNNPLECCMEVANNTSPQCLMTVSVSEEDVRNEDWFEFRYPKKPTAAMFTAWRRFVNWMYARNPNAYTGEALAEPVTFGPYTVQGIDEEQAANVLQGTVISTWAGTYDHDTYEYRMAKMLSECEDYMVLDSVIYHFLFIERHTMIDSVAKNTFWGSHDLQHWYLVHNYDDDTADGNDNEGGLTLTYGYEYQDTIGTKNVFNAASAVWFNFAGAQYDLLRTMYINREAVGAWDASALLARYRAWQREIPERVWNQDYWYKYLRRYEQFADDGYLAMLEGGQKTYQRQQFEMYQQTYIASKYNSSAATNDRITLRTYTPTTSGLVVAPANKMTITMYAKMYINILVGSIAKRVKAERGVAYELTFPEAGQLNDTETYIYSASMIQAIGDLSHLYPGYMAFANAVRLRSIQVSSTAEGYTNSNAVALSFGANRMLERLICPNLPNVQSAMDLSGCQALQYIDARGSGFTGFSFAPGGVLETALLPSPASISLRRLPYLDTFSMESDSNLTSLTVEGCPGIDAQAIVTAAENLVRVRLVGINWIEEDDEVSTLLARLYGLRGRDETDADIAQSVLTGSAYILTARQTVLARYAAAWPNLAVTYRSMVAQYALTFVNADGSPILGQNGQPYVQYVDRESDGYDPITAGEVDTPTMAATQAVSYTFSGWDDDFSNVTAPRTVTAVYTETPVQYTVRWHGENNAVLDTAQVDYGSPAVYNGVHPTDTSEESNLIFKLFVSWGQSTAKVTENMDVYPKWQRAALPEAGTSIEDMNLAELYAVQRTGTAANYVDENTVGDSFHFTMGYEPDFDNVESELLAEDLVLDGQTYRDTTCRPLAEDQDWTLVVDGVYDAPVTSGCLVSCYDSVYYAGFQFMYSGGFGAKWGTQSVNNGRDTTTGTVSNTTVITAQSRELIVMRHVAGNKNVLVYLSRPASNTILVSELTKTIATSYNGVIRLGADNTGNNYATGVLHRCKIWWADLGDEECRKMAAWPREKVNLQAISTAGASQPNGRYTGIDFIHDAPLCVSHNMNPTNTNEGGYDASAMDDWLESRYYNGLPEALREMLLTVVVRSVGYLSGSSGGEILTHTEKVYLPSVRDMDGRTAEPYLYCGTHIPWFTSDTKRRKAICVSVAPDAEVNTASTPASSPKVGDLWATSNGYIWNGRRWVACIVYWLRDAWPSSAANFGNVTTGGAVSGASSNASASYFVVPRLHI